MGKTWKDMPADVRARKQVIRKGRSKGKVVQIDFKNEDARARVELTQLSFPYWPEDVA